MAERIEVVLRQVIFEMLHPRTLVAITLQPTSVDGSFTAVAINAAVCALLDSGIPMKRVAYAASGIKDESEKLLLDPTEREETAASCQFLAVFDPTLPESSLYLNQTGRFNLESLPEVTKFLYENGICPVNEFITAALRKRFE